MMTLIKTSFLNGVAVLIRILTLLGINKILAIYVGPIGYAALGQLQNAITMITSFASGAVNTGVTKYTAEFYEDELRQRAVWQTAGTIALIGSGLTALVIVFFCKPIAYYFLNDEAYESVFIWFAVFLVFFVFNALLLAILNGKKEIGVYVLANIAGSLLALLMTTFLVLIEGLYGALLALALFQSVTFFVSLFLCYRTKWFKFSYLFGGFDKIIAYQLMKYTLMTLATAVCVPISHLFIRQHLGTTLGWEFAGYWEAMWRLSAAYLMLVTSTFSVYYLPRISELKSSLELKKEIIQCYKIILPVAVLVACFIYLLRDFIISLLFSAEFYPMRGLFLGQVIGDILKIGSWIVSFTMLGKAMIKYFILTEILFSVSFYILVICMTKEWGIQGVAWAYAMNYLIYWFIMYSFIFRKLEKIVPWKVQVPG